MANTVKRDWASPEMPAQKETSVSAHIIRSIAVTMSILEMETLIDSLGVEYNNLSETQRKVQQEFADAVHALR